MHLGDYQEDYAKVNFTFFTTVNGTPTALAGTPAISVYVGNSITQITGGITLTEGFDGNTGANQVLIDLSADAAYVVGEDYTAYLSAGTLGGISVVGQAVAYFSIENRRTEDVVALLPTALVGGRMDSDQGAKSGNVALSAQEKLDVNIEVDTAFTTQVADSVPADGTRGTREQLLYMLSQFMMEPNYSGTTVTIKKVDGSTTLFTLTLDDATNPTSATRET